MVPSTKGWFVKRISFFDNLLVSVKSIEKVTAHRNKSRNIVTGGKSRLYDSKQYNLNLSIMGQVFHELINHRLQTLWCFFFVFFT